MPSYKEIRESFDKVDKEWEERKAQQEREWQEEIARRKANGEKFVETGKIPKKRCDHPNTMEDSTATVVWLVVMLVGSIFKGNWVIWIVATVIWWRFITRYDD